MRRNYRDVNGILLLDKPVGLTSNRALQTVKRIFNARKAGHTGSLDPLASGLLPLCFGHATKASHWLLDADKTYEVTASIGAQTDTADAEGAIVATAEVAEVSESALQQSIAEHLGEIEQVPPMYSALKHEGRRLYELARAGEKVDRAPRKIRIYAIEIVKFDPRHPVLRVRCSKGTYIRTLVETVAEAMGTLAHVQTLRRTELGPFDAGRMVSLAQIEDLASDVAALDSLLIPADSALTRFSAVTLSATEAHYLLNGNPVGHAAKGIEGLVRVYDKQQGFLGVGEVLPDGRIAPKRLFLSG
jgi:tRNA pseudouridine55 synthase